MKIRYLVILSAAVCVVVGCDRETATKEQLALREEAKVSEWPGSDQAGQNGRVAELKPSECDALGGDVDYHQWCQPTRLKCTVGDRAICIDELDEIEIP